MREPAGAAAVSTTPSLGLSHTPSHTPSLASTPALDTVVHAVFVGLWAGGAHASYVVCARVADSIRLPTLQAMRAFRDTQPALEETFVEACVARAALLAHLDMSTVPATESALAAFVRHIVLRNESAAAMRARLELARDAALARAGEWHQLAARVSLAVADGNVAAVSILSTLIDGGALWQQFIEDIAAGCGIETVAAVRVAFHAVLAVKIRLLLAVLVAPVASDDAIKTVNIQLHDTMKFISETGWDALDTLPLTEVTGVLGSLCLLLGVPSVVPVVTPAVTRLLALANCSVTVARLVGLFQCAVGAGVSQKALWLSWPVGHSRAAPYLAVWLFEEILPAHRSQHRLSLSWTMMFCDKLLSQAGATSLLGAVDGAVVATRVLLTLAAAALDDSEDSVDAWTLARGVRSVWSLAGVTHAVARFVHDLLRNSRTATMGLLAVAALSDGQPFLVPRARPCFAMDDPQSYCSDGHLVDLCHPGALVCLLDDARIVPWQTVDWARPQPLLLGHECSIAVVMALEKMLTAPSWRTFTLLSVLGCQKSVACYCSDALWDACARLAVQSTGLPSVLCAADTEVLAHCSLSPRLRCAVQAGHGAQQLVQCNRAFHLRVRIAPRFDAPVVHLLNHGDRVDVARAQSNWCRWPGRPEWLTAHRGTRDVWARRFATDGNGQTHVLLAPRSMSLPLASDSVAVGALPSVSQIEECAPETFIVVELSNSNRAGNCTMPGALSLTLHFKHGTRFVVSHSCRRHVLGHPSLHSCCPDDGHATPLAAGLYIVCAQELSPILFLGCQSALVPRSATTTLSGNAFKFALHGDVPLAFMAEASFVCTVTAGLPGSAYDQGLERDIAPISGDDVQTMGHNWCRADSVAGQPAHWLDYATPRPPPTAVQERRRRSFEALSCALADLHPGVGPAVAHAATVLFARAALVFALTVVDHTEPTKTMSVSSLLLLVRGAFDSDPVRSVAAVAGFFRVASIERQALMLQEVTRVLENRGCLVVRTMVSSSVGSLHEASICLPGADLLVITAVAENRHGILRAGERRGTSSGAAGFDEGHHARVAVVGDTAFWTLVDLQGAATVAVSGRDLDALRVALIVCDTAARHDSALLTPALARGLWTALCDFALSAQGGLLALTLAALLSLLIGHRATLRDVDVDVAMHTTTRGLWALFEDLFAAPEPTVTAAKELNAEIKHRLTHLLLLMD